MTKAPKHEFLDDFNEYLRDAIKPNPGPSLSDVGSLIVLAIFEYRNDVEKTMEALTKAKAALSRFPIGEQAAEVIDGAFHHVRESGNEF